jgi:hypothetical protein
MINEIRAQIEAVEGMIEMYKVKLSDAVLDLNSELAWALEKKIKHHEKMLSALEYKYEESVELWYEARAELYADEDRELAMAGGDDVY